VAKSRILIIDIDIGLKKEDIHVEVKDRVLTISGEKKGMVRDGDEKFNRIERSRGHMERSLSLVQ
jgi:HSP20 family protein